jgi:hypothetical protein
MMSRVPPTPIERGSTRRLAYATHTTRDPGLRPWNSQYQGAQSRVGGGTRRSALRDSLDEYHGTLGLSTTAPRRSKRPSGSCFSHSAART